MPDITDGFIYNTRFNALRLLLVRTNKLGSVLTKEKQNFVGPNIGWFGLSYFGDWILDGHIVNQSKHHHTVFLNMPQLDLEETTEEKNKKIEAEIHRQILEKFVTEQVGFNATFLLTDPDDPDCYQMYYLVNGRILPHKGKINKRQLSEMHKNGIKKIEAMEEERKKEIIKTEKELAETVSLLTPEINKLEKKYLAYQKKRPTPRRKLRKIKNEIENKNKILAEKKKELKEKKKHLTETEISEKKEDVNKVIHLKYMNVSALTSLSSSLDPDPFKLNYLLIEEEFSQTQLKLEKLRSTGFAKSNQTYLVGSGTKRQLYVVIDGKIQSPSYSISLPFDLEDFDTKSSDEHKKRLWSFVKDEFTTIHNLRDEEGRHKNAMEEKGRRYRIRNAIWGPINFLAMRAISTPVCSVIGGIIGGVIGFFIGGPVGAAAGAALGAKTGAALGATIVPTILNILGFGFDFGHDTHRAFLSKDYKVERRTPIHELQEMIGKNIEKIKILEVKSNHSKEEKKELARLKNKDEGLKDQLYRTAASRVNRTRATLTTGLVLTGALLIIFGGPIGMAVGIGMQIMASLPSAYNAFANITNWMVSTAHRIGTFIGKKLKPSKKSEPYKEPNPLLPLLLPPERPKQGTLIGKLFSNIGKKIKGIFVKPVPSTNIPNISRNVQIQNQITVNTNDGGGGPAPVPPVPFIQENIIVSRPPTSPIPVPVSTSKINDGLKISSVSNKLKEIEKREEKKIKKREEKKTEMPKMMLLSSSPNQNVKSKKNSKGKNKRGYSQNNSFGHFSHHCGSEESLLWKDVPSSLVSING